ncbi:fimbrial protein [Lelliottia sp. V106_12]|uniref:Fimbrial protein n=2 Tax=Lelliottia wanjuensis TaxID=3050585 RepID=A0AAP4D3A7_9ENTR|nr:MULTISPECIES: fimbrial protein [unclassified Lelliottia]MDK9363420.1 fimbrial protein [Lelliottia sp. V106_12]MDK9585508.1 fimbrial protein [Lelliottia sp. V86_10]MDK9617062.1 fimbrial protein [Lelliottia sp. V106_9]
MNIRNNIISGSLLALASMSGFAAEMNAGTIHFTGEIIEPSCVIEGDDGTDSTVPLGTYPTSLFTDVGVESTLVPFSISLKDCPLKSDGLPSVQLTFTGTTTLTGVNNLLDVSKKTTAGTTAALGVGVAVSLDGKDTNLITMDGAEGQVKVPLTNKVDDILTTNFNARYRSFTKTVEAGPADADMTVNIIYR